MFDLSKMPWDKPTEEKFKKMLSKMPIFHRHMAEVTAIQKAELNAKERGGRVVTEEDIVRAFFSEVPLQFYSLMIKLMDDVGFEYKKFNLPAKKTG
ncbi:MAG: hypothetical protein V1863_03860 [Candidatus Omnitrophota bacterium]